MQILTDIASISSEEWKALITDSPASNWFQSPDAYALFAYNRKETQPFVVAVRREEEQKLVGLVVGYATRSSWALWQRFTERVIIQGGPILAKDIQCEEVKALWQGIRQTMPSAIYAEIRAFADYSIYRSDLEEAGWQYRPHYDVWIDCSEGYFHRIHDTQRRHINKAKAEGTQWHEAKSEEEVNQFYTLLRMLYRRKVRRPVFSREFILSAWQKGWCKVLVVEKDHQITGGVLMPILNDIAYEWYICGNVMASWAMIDYCASHQIHWIDTMGAGEPDIPYGVRDFKLQMGGELHEYGRYLYIRDTCRYRLGKALIQWREKRKLEKHN